VQTERQVLSNTEQAISAINPNEDLHSPQILLSGLSQPDRGDHKDSEVQRDHKDSEVQRDHKDFKVQRDYKDSKVQQDRKDSKVHLALHITVQTLCHLVEILQGAVSFPVISPMFSSSEALLLAPISRPLTFPTQRSSELIFEVPIYKALISVALI
jgi:hypothetical protein